MKQLLLSAVLLLAATARADIPPPDISGCQDKQAGASCETDDRKSGACQQSKCSRLDYSNGPPPTSVEYDCLKCVASATANEGKGGNGCTAAPGAPLALVALLTGWLTRHKRRSA